MTEAIRRGDVWIADLDKRRPVVILTRDPIADRLNAVLVAPVTSTVRGLAVEVPIGPADGIAWPSVLNLDQLERLDVALLERRVGRVRDVTLRAVCRAAALAIGCG